MDKNTDRAIRNALDAVIGRRFVYGGRDNRKGLDCWGLVMYVMGLYGFDIPDYDPNNKAVTFDAIDRLAKAVSGSGHWTQVTCHGVDDFPLVVLMRLHPKYINHAGVYVGRNRIMHTTLDTKVVRVPVSSLKRAIVGYYRYVPGC